MVPEFLRDTEQPLLGMVMLVVPLAHAIRAVLWALEPPEQGGRALAAVSALLALSCFVLWRLVVSTLRSDEAPSWLAGGVVGVMGGSVFVTVAASGGTPLLAVAMAVILALRDDQSRALASSLIIALPSFFLDLSDPQVITSVGSAVAVAIAGSGIVRRRRDGRGLRLAVRARLSELISEADDLTARRTTMVAGLAHDVRGPLQGAVLAVQLAEARFGDDLAPAVREATSTLAQRCMDAGQRLSDIISDLRRPPPPLPLPAESERESLLRDWHAKEQLDLPVFMSSLTALLFVVFGFGSGVWFGLHGSVLILMAIPYALLATLSRASAPPWLGSEGETWLILAPGLLWFGWQAVDQLSTNLALALALFWLGAITSRPRTLVIAGSGMVALTLSATRSLDVTLVFIVMVFIVHVYSRATLKLAEQAADWALRIESRHEQVRQSSAEIDRVMHEHLHEIRGLGGQLVDDARALRDLADSGSPSEALPFYDRAHQALSGLASLIPETLEGGRPDTDGKRTTRLGEVTRWLKHVFTERIDVIGGTLVFDVVPGTEASISEPALRKILINLVDNAVKFSPPGGHVEVRAYPLPSEGCVVVSVGDQGPGFSEGEISRVFRLFEQGSDDLEASQDGFGIGLAVVAALVQDVGGRIEIESQPGSTCVRLIFEA